VPGHKPGQKEVGVRFRVLKVSVLGGAMILSASAAPVPAQGLAKVDLVPHQAIYVLELGHTRQGGNVSGARGALVMEWVKACSGWTVKQRLKLNITDNSNNMVETESNFSSFESVDGLTYRFTSRNTRAGRVTEDFQGKARLKPGGGGGGADYSQPKGTRYDLPKGSMFPTQHMVELITAARRGEKLVYRTVFDGAGIDGPLAVSAVLGRHLARATNAWAKEPLTNRPSWRIRLAFFPLKDSKAEPDYELGFRLFDNGVADNFEIDYGTFSVKARLERIEALEQPKC
jgi:hypothetical protein